MVKQLGIVPENQGKFQWTPETDLPEGSQYAIRAGKSYSGFFAVVKDKSGGGGGMKGVNATITAPGQTVGNKTVGINGTNPVTTNGTDSMTTGSKNHPTKPVGNGAVTTMTAMSMWERVGITLVTVLLGLTVSNS